MAAPDNSAVASKLREMADILELQQADGFRIAAYRRAADTLERLTQPIEDTVRAEGLAGLVELPGIGRGIGSAIMEMLSTGRWGQLERLQGQLEPEQLFQTLPGIGPELARRIHDALHIDTLEALELAAHDGRLGNVSGIGHRRAAAIRAALADRLGRRRIPAHHPGKAPPIAVLLDVDREYRQKAAAGELRTIAPKRFNPTGEAWLPVFHAARGDWRLTALFSNTRQAHQLGKTKDWVVIYFHLDTEPESQCTVVTETRGVLEGQRVVRGREEECAAHYGSTPARTPRTTFEALPGHRVDARRSPTRSDRALRHR
jgi:putative hydrolase